MFFVDSPAKKGPRRSVPNLKALQALYIDYMPTTAASNVATSVHANPEGARPDSFAFFMPRSAFRAHGMACMLHMCQCVDCRFPPTSLPGHCQLLGALSPSMRLQARTKVYTRFTRGLEKLKGTGQS